MHLPRIGQEVLVSFLEGDPDRPLVTGRVYNGAAKPPFELPGGKTQSGIRSRSTPKGTAANANELRFEDKKGEEEFFFQAEKDLVGLVKNDATVDVKKNQTETIGEKLMIDVGDQITIRTGSASIVMKKNGDIEIAGKKILVKGMDIQVKADTKIQIEAGVSLKAKGAATASVEGGMLDLKASGIATLKGSLTKIG